MRALATSNHDATGPAAHRGGSSVYPKADLRAIVGADTQSIVHYEDNQIVDEHYLQEMKRVVGHANAAEVECDDARRRLKQLRSALEAALHKRASAGKMVADYKQRLEQLEVGMVELTRQIGQEEASRRDREAHQKQETLRAEAAAPLNKEQLEALRIAMERSESRVVALRQRHMDAHTFLKGLRSDMEFRRQAVKEAEGRKKELENARLQLAASEANNAFRDARSTKNDFELLQRRLTEQANEISAIRVEKQAMILHLIDGSRERTEQISSLRSRVAATLSDAAVQQSLKSTSSTSSQPGDVGNDRELLQQLIFANKQLRADSVNVLLNTAQEKEALEQYVGVLSERSGDLMNRVKDVKKVLTSTTGRKF